MRHLLPPKSLAFSLLLGACSSQSPAADDAAKGATKAATPATRLDPAKLREQAKASFGSLPASMPSESNPLSDEKIALGRQLYYDTRLSKNHDVACESCHRLADFGVDGEPTSPGHKGQRGGRNSPTVYNAGLHVAQFWDGRAADLEKQAEGPILNPIEMALPDEAAAVGVVASIPEYVTAFDAAFPGEGLTYENIARAIAAFERKLVTPGPFDAFLAGDDAALSDEALRGLGVFYDAGCIACHSGPAFGGGMYQKLGLLEPYPTEDLGRFEVTKKDGDRHVFKVPSLRNIAKTGPYLHDGSVATLEQMVKIMVEHQTPKGSIEAEELSALLAFLEALTGELPSDYIQKPELPPSGPNTPKPDPA